MSTAKSIICFFFEHNLPKPIRGHPWSLVCTFREDPNTMHERLLEATAGAPLPSSNLSLGWGGGGLHGLPPPPNKFSIV